MEGEEIGEKTATIAHHIDAVPRTKDVSLKQIVPFSKMVLCENLQKGLQNGGFIYPTLIQEIAIPFGRSGMDLIVQSKSGTGKTLIFCCIVLEAYNSALVEPQSLIVVPTREIAIQIVDVLNTLSKYFKDFRAVAVVGGLDVMDDRKRLQAARSVVGTPGRILHLIQNNVLNTGEIKLFVLDEVDRMFTASFHSDVQRIRESLAACKQMVACTATLCDDLNDRLRKVMRNPLMVCNQGKAVLLFGIKQFAYELPEYKTSILEMKSKLEALRFILGRVTFKQCILFAGSQSRASSYYNYLQKDGWPCELMSAGLEQKARLKTFQNFRDFKIRMLVATDLMSRGVDSEHVNLVINLELPTDMVTYLHRIGRAGRFGSHGLAINFVSSAKDCQQLTEIIAQIGGNMKMYRFPTKTVDQQTFDTNLWNFTSTANDIKHFGIFSSELYLNSNENKENIGPSINTADSITTTASQIDTKTFILEANDGVKHLPDGKVQAATLTTSASCYNSSQYLVSSNTIDDASSIAADSSLSNDGVLVKSSTSMKRIPVSKLVKFLVDPVQTESNLKADNGNETHINTINLFDDYAEQVLNNMEESNAAAAAAAALSPTAVSSQSQSLNSSKLNKLKDLLIEKTDAEKQAQISDYYAEFNEICKEDAANFSMCTTPTDSDKSQLNGFRYDEDNDDDDDDDDDEGVAKDFASNHVSEHTSSSAVLPSAPDVTPQNIDIGIHPKLTMNKASQVMAADVENLDDTPTTTSQMQMASAASKSDNGNKKIRRLLQNSDKSNKPSLSADDRICENFNNNDIDHSDLMEQEEQEEMCAEEMDTNNDDKVLETEYFSETNSHQSEAAVSEEDEFCYFTDEIGHDDDDDDEDDDEEEAETEDEWNSGIIEVEGEKEEDEEDEFASDDTDLGDEDVEEESSVSSEEDYFNSDNTVNVPIQSIPHYIPNINPPDPQKYQRFVDIFQNQYQFIRNYVALNSNQRRCNNLNGIANI